MVSVLGPVVVRGGRHDVAIAAGKQRQLLAALALRPREVVPADRLIEDLWGDEPPAQADKTLRAHVSHLRATLADGGLPDVVVSRRPGYVLDVAVACLDVDRFRQTVIEGRVALRAGDAQQASERLAAALSLWRGSPAMDCALSAALRARAVHLEEERLGALEDRLSADLHLGRHGEVIGEIEVLIASHPLRERLRELHMLALYRSGRQAEALRAYQAARAALVDELGIEPGEGLRSMEQAILNHDPRLALEAPAASTQPSVSGRVVAEPGRELVGRDDQLTHLLAALDDHAGRGGLMLITGEGGTGKSALLDEFARQASDRALILRGRCDETAGSPPFWPWVQVIRDLSGQLTDDEVQEVLGRHAGDVVQLTPELSSRLGVIELPPPLEPDAARFHLFDAVASVLARAARHRRLVVLLDDMQWADSSSVELLAFMAPRLEDGRLVAVAAWRPEAHGRAQAAVARLATLGSLPASHRLPVGPLDRGEVAALLRVAVGESVAPGVSAAVFDRTGGNPLLVLELARLLGKGGDTGAIIDASLLPDDSRALVLARVAGLSPAARALTDVAAVFGRAATVAEIYRTGAVDRADVLDGLDECLQSGVLHAVGPDGERYEFHHDLTRQAVYADLSLSRRVSLHRTVAEAIEYLDPTASRLDELAVHYFQASMAGPDVSAKAFDYAVRGAENAGAAFAYERAVEHYRRAISLHELGAGDVPRSHLMLRMGEAAWHAGSSSTARESFARAAALGRQDGDAEVIAHAALGHGLGGVTNGTVDDELIETLEEALLLMPSDRLGLRARLLARLAVEQYFSPRLDHAGRLAAHAVETARESGDPAVLTEALHALHFCLRRPDRLQDRVAITPEILARAEDAEAPELVLRARHARIGDFVELGDLASVAEELGAYAGLAGEVSDPRYAALAVAWRSMLAALDGDLATAEQLATEALNLGAAQAPDTFMQIYGVQFGTLRWLQGRSAEVVDTVASFVDAYPAAPAWRSALALFHCEANRPDEARAILAELAHGGFIRLPRDANWLSAIAVLAVVCWRLKEASHAAVLYELLSPFANHHVAVGGVATSGSYGAAQHYLGLLAATTDRPDDARAHLEAALTANASSLPWLAQTKAVLGRLLTCSSARRNRTRGDQLLAEADEMARRMGLAVAAVPSH